jgi:hypothetical protein
LLLPVNVFTAKPRRGWIEAVSPLQRGWRVAAP